MLWGKRNDIRHGFPPQVCNLLAVWLWEIYFLSDRFNRDEAQRASAFTLTKQNPVFVLGEHTVALDYFFFSSLCYK